MATPALVERILRVRPHQSRRHNRNRVRFV
jgi:hypothetical protein